ncbi:MAG: aminotransferase class V-fold PLP-dependent enzyme [Bacteroidota bacterium]
MKDLDRRHFLKTINSMAAGLSTIPLLNPAWLDVLEEKLAVFNKSTPQDAARDEDYWTHIQQAFNPSPLYINLENGYMSPQPIKVMQAQLANIQMINERTSFYMRRQAQDEVKGANQQIAALAGVSTEELIITRNTTEALDTVIAGIDFEAGDEAIMCDLDYSSMLQAFDQQSRRLGLVTKYIKLPLHPDSDEQIVEIYRQAITPKTKIILVTHLNNITGMILPVRKICDMAHEHGVEVICDGAHSFAHLDYKIPDLHCDYFGASLHKWLCTPMGAGILYVKKEKINKVWPLFGDTNFPEDDIRKFAHIGIHPVSTNLTVSNAIRFHNMIGAARKEARLKYLKQYWTEQVRDLASLTIHTPWDAYRASALVLISVDGYTPDELVEALYEHYRIFTVARINPVVTGVRITPHLYTRIKELDALVHALKAVCSN